MLFLKHTPPEPERTTFPEERFPLTPHQLSQQIAEQLEEVERLFNMTSDPDLIDAYIYERAALMARLRHLLRSQRELPSEEKAPAILRK